MTERPWLQCIPNALRTSLAERLPGALFDALQTQHHHWQHDLLRPLDRIKFLGLACLAPDDFIPKGIANRLRIAPELYDWVAKITAKPSYLPRHVRAGGLATTPLHRDAFSPTCEVLFTFLTRCEGEVKRDCWNPVVLTSTSRWALSRAL